MTNRVAHSLPSPIPRQSNRLFDIGPYGRLAPDSPAKRTELERFSTALRAVVGASVAQVRARPHREGGTTCWSLDITGREASISMKFEESGSTRLPTESPTDGTGEVADSVDAFYLFEFIERELSSAFTDY